jgi:CBS domain-containing protein
VHHRVQDVMTRDVACAHGDTPYKELVRLLAGRRVSALPVVDDRGRVLGIVSEADLLPRPEQSARPVARLLSARRRRRERARAEATVAAELMTRPAVTVDPLAAVTEAARRMHRAGVKRLPVVDVVGRLVGFVSRVDLLSSFLRPDEELRREIVGTSSSATCSWPRTGSTSMCRTAW